MGTGLFCKSSPLAKADAVLSSSTADGLTTQAPTAGAANKGILRPRASAAQGAPTAAVDLDLALQAGGLANGYFGLTEGVPGATLRWQNQGDTSSQWRGHTDNIYATYARTIDVGSLAGDYPQVGEVRRIPSGEIGFVRVATGAISNTAQFVYKGGRTDSWTTASITTGASAAHRPTWVVLPSGRLIAFVYVSTPARWDAFYSDDNGQTWAAWSTSTRITATVGGQGLSADVVGDAIVAVLGATEATATHTMRVYWSLDGGQTFSLTYTGDAADGIARVCVTKTGQALLAYNNTTTGRVVPLLFGGGLGASVASWAAQAARPQVALVTHDDGTIWLLSSGVAADPLTAVACSVSLDNGADFVTLTNSIALTDNRTFAGTPRGPLGFSAGSWDGSIVLVFVTETVSITTSNGNVELWLGGYDSLTETMTNTGEGPSGTLPYSGLTYIADDLPDNLGATKTDIGAGATVALSGDGLNIVATAADNSSYSWPATLFSTGDGFRKRFVFRVNSGGSVANDSAILYVAHSDGVNLQWWKIRFNTGQIRLLDNSGTLATSPTVANQFTAHTELFVAWAHDTPSTGGGTLSVWYRITGSDHWTALATNHAIAEQAGAATEEIVIGGTAAATATDWDISFLALAEGGRFYGGFTNPTDLHGRPLSSAIDFEVKNGVRVGAFGGPGVQGDTYDLATTYSYGPRNIWSSQRPSCRWQSPSDNATANIVFHAANNTLRGNFVALFGTNTRTARVMWNSADSWATPTHTQTLDAMLWQGITTVNLPGLVRVDGTPFIPHQFRSEPGRRYFLDVGASPSDAYEIVDNDSSTLFVTNLPDTFGAGARVRVWGDRMAAILPSDIEAAYMRVDFSALHTADGKYHLGNVLFNMRHDITEPYAQGFVDRHLPQVEVFEAEQGQVHVSVLGPERHEARLAWDPIDRASDDYLDRLMQLVRALRGQAGVVCWWRDTTDLSTLGLYRVTGPAARENVYGEGMTELARAAQILLTEVR